MPSTDIDGTPILILRLEEVISLKNLLIQLSEETRTGESKGYLQHFIHSDQNLQPLLQKVQKFLSEC